MDPSNLMRLEGTWRRAVQSPTTVDVDGNPTVTETQWVVRCWVVPTGSSEDTDLQQRSRGDFTAYVPGALDVAAADRLTVDDVTYEVTGPAEAWTHPRTMRTICRTVPMRVVA